MTEKDKNCFKNIKKKPKNKQNIVKITKKKNLTKEKSLLKWCQVAK